MDAKTVGGTSDFSLMDPLYQKQKEGVARMRTSLLACVDTNGITTKYAIDSIIVMRIYHQLIRIVKYTELMDKLEAKLYESIEYTIDSANPESMFTWTQLLNLQERLQKNMIESHKMLQPYLDVKEFSIVDLVDSNKDASTDTTIAINAETRDNVRIKAQAILSQLEIIPD